MPVVYGSACEMNMAIVTDKSLQCSLVNVQTQSIVVYSIPHSPVLCVKLVAVLLPLLHNCRSSVSAGDRNDFQRTYTKDGFNFVALLCHSF